jgi:pyruvate kinase
MSRNNTAIPIVALTPNLGTLRKLSLYRNVVALPLEQSDDREAVLKSVEALLMERGIVVAGDTVVFTWGEPLGVVGGTNALKIMKIGG